MLLLVFLLMISTLFWYVLLLSYKLIHMEILFSFYSVLIVIHDGKIIREKFNYDLEICAKSHVFHREIISLTLARLSSYLDSCGDLKQDSVGITMYDYVWLSMTMYDYVRLNMTMYDYIWLCMTRYEYVWLCMTI